jgi:hypothetical protein
MNQTPRPVLHGDDHRRERTEITGCSLIECGRNDHRRDIAVKSGEVSGDRRGVEQPDLPASRGRLVEEDKIGVAADAARGGD